MAVRKHLAKALLFLSLFCLAPAAHALSTNNVAFNFTTFGLQANQVLSVTIQGQYWAAVPSTFFINPPQTISRANYPQMTNGSVVFSNQVCGQPFSVVFKGYYDTYATNYFIPSGTATNNQGNVDASLYVGQYGGPSSFYYAYLNGFSFATNYTVFTNTYNVTNSYTITNNISGTNVNFINSSNVFWAKVGGSNFAYVPFGIFDISGAATAAGSTERAAMIATNSATLVLTTNLVQASTNGLNTSLLASITATNTVNLAITTNLVQASTNKLNTDLRAVIIATNTANLMLTTNLVQSATNDPAITRLGTNPVTSIFISGSGTLSARTTNANGVSYTIFVAQQTNGFGDIVYSNHAAFVTPAQLAASTNGTIGTNSLAPYANTNYVNESTNTLSTSLLASIAATNRSNLIITTNLVQAATNGLPAGIWTLGTASQVAVSALVTQAQLVLATNSSYISATNYSKAADTAVSNGVAVYALFVSQNATNQANFVGGRATNNDTVVSNGVVTFSSGLSLNSTNQSNLIGARATNNDMVVSNGVISFSVTISQNATNQSLLIGARATNNDTVVSNGVVSFASMLSVNSTNNANLIGSRATNNDVAVSNSVVTFATNTFVNMNGGVLTNGQAWRTFRFGNWTNFNLTTNLIGSYGAPISAANSTWENISSTMWTNVFYPEWGIQYSAGNYYIQSNGVSFYQNTGLEGNWTVVLPFGIAPAPYSAYGSYWNINGTKDVGNLYVSGQINSTNLTAQIIAIAGTNSGSSGFTNAGGVTQGWLTNQSFSLAGSNTIAAIASQYLTNGAGATNVFLTAGNSSITITTNSPSAWTLSVPSQTFLTNGMNTAAFATTNRFLPAGPGGYQDAQLLTNAPFVKTMTSPDSSVTFTFTRNADGSTNAALAAVGGSGGTTNFNLSGMVSGPTTNTIIGSTGSNYIYSIASTFGGVASNAIAMNNGFGTNTTFINHITLSSTNSNGVMTNNLDPDAVNFFMAAGMTNYSAYLTNITAVNNLVLSLKAANLWTNCMAIYPFAAGTVAGDAINLKTNSLPISWGGFLSNSAAHTPAGISNNGTIGSIGLIANAVRNTLNGQILNANGHFVYVSSGLTTNNSALAGSNLGSQGHGAVSLSASSTNAQGHIYEFSATGANPFATANGNGNVLFGVNFLNPTTNSFYVTANGNNSTLTFTPWNTADVFTMGVSGIYNSSTSGIQPANSNIVEGFYAITQPAPGATNLTTDQVLTFQTIVSTYIQNMQGIGTYSATGTNSILLYVDANPYPNQIGSTNTSELHVNSGATFDGIVKSAGLVAPNVTTGNLSTSGNLDAGSISVNGNPLNFGVNTATSLFLTNNPTSAAYFFQSLTNANGIFYFNTTGGTNIWTNSVGWEMVPKGYTNNLAASNDLASYSIITSNLNTYPIGAFFYKNDSSLIGSWLPLYAHSVGDPTYPGSLPLVSVLTYTNVVPQSGTYTGTFIATNLYANLINSTNLYATNLNAFGSTAGMVLTSVGATLLPIWSNPPAGGVAGLTNLPVITIYPNTTNFYYNGVWYYPTNSKTAGIQEAINLLPTAATPYVWGGGKIALAAGAFYTYTNIAVNQLSTNPFSLTIEGAGMSACGIVGAFTGTVFTVGSGVMENHILKVSDMWFASTANVPTNLIHINGHGFGNAVGGGISNVKFYDCWFGYWKAMTNNLDQGNPSLGFSPSGGGNTIGIANNLIVNVDCNWDLSVAFESCQFTFLAGLSWTADHGQMLNNLFGSCGILGGVCTTNNWPTNSPYRAGANVYVLDSQSNIGGTQNGNEGWSFSGNNFIGGKAAYFLKTGFQIPHVSYDDTLEFVDGWAITAGQKWAFINPSASGSVAGWWLFPSYILTNTTDYSLASTYNATNWGATNPIVFIDNVRGTNSSSFTFIGNVKSSSFTGSGSNLISLNASSFTSGTLPAAQLPAFTGSITNSSGSSVTWLGSFTSSQLIGAVSDETGSGSLVFGTSPTLTTANVNGLTNSDLIAGQFVIADANKRLTSTLNANGLTNYPGIADTSTTRTISRFAGDNVKIVIDRTSGQTFYDSVGNANTVINPSGLTLNTGIFTGNGSGLTNTSLGTITPTNAGFSILIRSTNGAGVAGGQVIGYAFSVDTNLAMTISDTNAGTTGGGTNPLVIIYAPLATAALNKAAPSSITFPATTVNWTNTTGYNLFLFIDNTGVTGTAIRVNGQQIFGSILPTDFILPLQAGEYFSETYSIGTPTARSKPY